jgi:P-type conjugative transfer protein TrbG
MNRVLLASTACFVGFGLAAAAPPSTGPVTKAAPVATPAKAVRPVTVAAAPMEEARLHRLRPRRHGLSPVLRTVAVATTTATAEPAAQGFVNAVQIYPYAEGMVFHGYTAPGQVTDIALQPGETLGAVASGDTVRWVIGDTTSGAGDTKRTHVLVKPFTAGLATNLVITTDRRAYHLALTSTARTAMAALSWTYPQDALIALRKAAEQQSAAAPVATGLALDDLHFDYALSGDQPTWRPLRAFDDGRQTFIEFPATLAVGEAPPLFIVNGKGDAQLVNYRVQGRFYVVDRLFDAAELRLGTKHQQIVRISRNVAASSDRQRRAS